MKPFARPTLLQNKQGRASTSNEGGIDGKANRTIRLHAEHCAPECISAKNRNVDVPVVRAGTSNSLRTKDREANSINNSDLAVMSDIVRILWLENSDHALLRRMLHESGG
jgi:hypothetical protein